MMEVRECKQFLGNLSVCEQLSGREKAGKLECSKNIKSNCVFKDVRVLLLKEPINAGSQCDAHSCCKQSLVDLVEF